MGLDEITARDTVEGQRREADGQWLMAEPGLGRVCGLQRCEQGGQPERTPTPGLEVSEVIGFHQKIPRGG
jgi:hypothetical protein